MHKLRVSTRHKNVDAVAANVDDKIFTDHSDNKQFQINRLQAQLSRLDATAEAIKGNRASNSRKPPPVKMAQMPKTTDMVVDKKYEAPNVQFTFSSEKKLRERGQAARSVIKEASESKKAILGELKS